MSSTEPRSEQATAPPIDYAKLDLTPTDEGKWARRRADAKRAFDLTILFAASQLPVSLAYRMARQAGRIRRARLGASLDAQKRYMQARLNLTDAQAEECLTRTFELMAFEDLDCWLCDGLTSKNLASRFRFEGEENIESALARRHGALLFGAHSYAQQSLLIASAVRGYPVNVIVRRRPDRQRSPLDNWFFARQLRKMDAVGNIFVPTQPKNPFLAAEAARTLRKNRFVALQIDTRSGQSEDAEFEFLHELKWFSQGSARIAQGSGAPLIDYSLHRPKDGIPAVVRFGEPIYVADPLEATRLQVERVERNILADPATWTIWADRFNRRRVRQWIRQFVPGNGPGGTNDYRTMGPDGKPRRLREPI